MPDPALCPCGSALPYPACCGRWHAGPEHLMAPDALALMRSRYCAYVLGLTDYLLATWHPSSRPAVLQLEPGLRWLGLTVKRHQPHGLPGAAPDDPPQATVEFVARSKQAGRAHRLHETSRFVQWQGRWVYLDGQAYGDG